MVGIIRSFPFGLPIFRGKLAVSFYGFGYSKCPWRSPCRKRWLSVKARRVVSALLHPGLEVSDLQSLNYREGSRQVWAEAKIQSMFHQFDVEKHLKAQASERSIIVLHFLMFSDCNDQKICKIEKIQRLWLCISFQYEDFTYITLYNHI